MSLSARAALFALCAGMAAFAPAGLAAAAVGSGCARMAFAEAAYVVCRFDARRDDLQLYLKDPDGRPYGDFSSLASALAEKKRKLVFAMNAGMFGEDFLPIGLYVENGKRLRRADTRDGASNFHLKPNGVFWIGDGAAGVAETSRFLAAPPAARYATQSGPMMVIEGRIHPKILPTGLSEKMRNGVCVHDGAEVLFAISEAPVTFHAFATLFRDGLHCADALFLDGSVSSLYAPELDRDDEIEELGPMVGVTVPAP